MNNRQISINIKYGNEIYKKKFLEHDALDYISFLEKFKLWYEIQNATDGEQPCFDEQNKDENE
tara:strand:+ start:1345 stop:1533 length:189 start_codon:yes stop_codon:yes gene_type:complete